MTRMIRLASSTSLFVKYSIFDIPVFYHLSDICTARKPYSTQRSIIPKRTCQLYKICNLCRNTIRKRINMDDKCAEKIFDRNIFNFAIYCLVTTNDSNTTSKDKYVDRKSVTQRNYFTRCTRLLHLGPTSWRNRMDSHYFTINLKGALASFSTFSTAHHTHHTLTRWAWGWFWNRYRFWAGATTGA
jgi:hypothetical protein